MWNLRGWQSSVPPRHFRFLQRETELHSDTQANGWKILDVVENSSGSSRTIFCYTVIGSDGGPAGWRFISSPDRNNVIYSTPVSHRNRFWRILAYEFSYGKRHSQFRRSTPQFKHRSSVKEVVSENFWVAEWASFPGMVEGRTDRIWEELQKNHDVQSAVMVNADVKERRLPQACSEHNWRGRCDHPHARIVALWLGEATSYALSSTRLWNLMRVCGRAPCER